MAVTVQQEVAALYSAIFNRAPDQEGLNNWVNAIEGGASLAQAAEGFVQHPVFAELYAGLTNIQFVQQLYINVLGSEGDAKGIQNWANLLASGVSKAQVVADFVQGALSVDLDAMLASGELTQAEFDAAVIRQDTLTNKANVGVYFAETFGAASNLDPATDTSTVAGLQADPAYLASQAAIANVTADAASVTAAQGRIDVAVGTDDPAGSLIGQNSALTAALVDLAEAQKAAADFLEENELADQTAVNTAVTDAQSKLDNEVSGTNISLAVANGYLTDRKAAVVTAQNDVAAKQKAVNEVEGAAAAIAARDATAIAKTAADASALTAKAAAAGAETNFLTLNSTVASVSYTDGVAVTPAAGAPVVTVGTEVTTGAGTNVITFDTDGKNLIIVEAYKEVAGVNELLAAVKADQAAVAAAAKATTDASNAANAVTSNTKINAVDVALTAAKGTLKTANDEVTELTTAINELEAALKVQADYKGLTDAIESAVEAVEALGVTIVTGTGTAEDDLFLASDAANASIGSFGTAGNDLLFIGTEYKAGTGDYSKLEGDANALEVFIIQGATGAEIKIETETFGSNATGQADVTTITLTGVNAEDLVLENGFVSYA